ncbi:MAG: FtsX-like permease family protein [Burkholderiales bacterium]|nr:MAG: FtsX-like permease family protein [Burkholderiales bacterium]
MLWLLAHVIGGYARGHPLRAAVQVIAIAVGVSLGYAVHLINASALTEFSAAVRQASGQADASVVGPREGFDEAVYARVAASEAVEWASPALDVEAPIVEPPRLRGRSLPIQGVDILRSAVLAPQTIGEPVDKDQRFALLDDGLYLSPAALEAMQLSAGETIGLQVGGRIERIRIAGRLPAAREGQIVAVMDLGFAQWRLDRLGRLTRIDLQFAAGSAPQAAAAQWQLPAGVSLQTAEGATARVSNLSRAYRVNLNVLALVALFTGAFLVYSLQAQAVLARRAQLAFLRVIGTTRGEVERLLLLESAALGVIGSALGIALGLAVAASALHLLGGDLGGGFFTGVRPPLQVDAGATLLFFTLGVAAATVGGWLPARDAAASAPALALKAGSGLDRDIGVQRAWPALALAALALLLLGAPPLQGIPLGAYLAIAVLLVAAILAKPLLAPRLFGPLQRWLSRRRLSAEAAPWWLAATRLAATPRFAAIGAAGIVASFALMVAMATMVASFRVSVDQWLARVLPADIYVRPASAPAGSLGSTTATFSEDDRRTLSTHPQVERAEFSLNLKITLDPARAPVSLIARPLDRSHAARKLPLTGEALAWRDGMPPPAWVSEAIVDIYGARVGGRLALPIAGQAQEFVVAGVWRDYARQFGAVIVDADDYTRLAGVAAPTEAALWLAPGASAAEVAADLQPKMQLKSAEFASAGEIRAISLRIFDRSFAVTYVLEIAAIVIGLTGIAATFSAQAIVRMREFGMLRHLGVTKGQILALLAIEGLLVTALAIVIGLAVGLAIAWILVDFVNPQSFHWTMDFRVPLALVAGLIVALLAAAALTALAAGRRAVAPDAVLAVRADW